MTIGRIMILAAILVLSSGRAWSHEYRIGSLEIVHPWARATKVSEGDKCALFMTVINNGDAADRLIGASTPLADAVVVHLHSSSEQSDQEQAIGGINLPAGAETVLTPSGHYHLMLIGLKQDLEEYDTIPLTLNFEHAGTIRVEAEVEAPDAGTGTE